MADKESKNTALETIFLDQFKRWDYEDKEINAALAKALDFHTNFIKGNAQNISEKNTTTFGGYLPP